MPSALNLLRGAQGAGVPALAHRRKIHPSSQFLESSKADQALHSILCCAGKLEQQIKSTLLNKNKHKAGRKEFFK